MLMQIRCTDAGRKDSEKHEHGHEEGEHFHSRSLQSHCPFLSEGIPSENFSNISLLIFYILPYWKQFVNLTSKSVWGDGIYFVKDKQKWIACSQKDFKIFFSKYIQIHPDML